MRMRAPRATCHVHAHVRRVHLFGSLSIVIGGAYVRAALSATFRETVNSNLVADVSRAFGNPLESAG